MRCLSLKGPAHPPSLDLCGVVKTSSNETLESFLSRAYCRTPSVCWRDWYADVRPVRHNCGNLCHAVGLIWGRNSAIFSEDSVCCGSYYCTDGSHVDGSRRNQGTDRHSCCETSACGARKDLPVGEHFGLASQF